MRTEKEIPLKRHQHLFQYYVEHGLEATCKRFEITESKLKSTIKAHATKGGYDPTILTPERSELIRKMAMQYVRKRGQSREEAEDFASYCLIKAWRNSRWANNFYLWTAWLDYKKPKGYVLEYDDEAILENFADPKTQAPFESETVKLAIDESGLADDERRCFVLYFLHGLTNVEIGYVFQLTPSRISQLLTKAKNKIADHLKKGKLW